MAFTYFIKNFLSVIFLFLITSHLHAGAKQSSIAFNGVLNLENRSWESDQTVRLDGNWQFHWNKLLSPTEVKSIEYHDSYFQLPDLWSSPSINKEEYSNYGYATFALKVIGKFQKKKMALLVPAMYCSYELWVNNQKIAQNGQVADNKEGSKPLWQPMAGVFESSSDTLNITLQISNFRHSKGGVGESIIIGSKENIMHTIKQRRYANLIHIVGIGILSLLSFIVFLVYRKSYFLWFALFSLMWSIRGVFSNMYLIHEWVRDFNWTVGVKIEYLTLYLSLLLGMHIFHQLYAKYTYQLFNKISLIINGIFILITIITPVSFFSGLLLYFFIILGVFLCYALTCVINALIHSEKGSGALTFGIVIIIGLFFYDLLAYQNIVAGNPYILNLGYIIIYYLLGISLTYHTLVSNKKTNEINTNW